MSDYQPKILSGGEHRSDDEIMADYGVSEDSPLVIMELLQRFHVKDIMRSRNIISLTRENTLREAKELMRDNKISGLPILEGKRLFGMVSMNQIIKALEGGWLDDPCQQHMSTSLVVLEEDIPVSIALKYFHNYTFGRFPVLNKEHEFVGILSQRDITSALLKELTSEISKLEGKTGAAVIEQRPVENVKSEWVIPYYSLRQFVVVRNDLANAGKAANEIKRMLKETGVNSKIIRKVAVAAYELEINVCIHSLGGSLTIVLDTHKVTIIAKDNGPGIKDVDWACQDGTSTANDWIRSMGFGAGMGLSNCKRVADTFNIKSVVPTGTTVICEFNLSA